MDNNKNIIKINLTNSEMTLAEICEDYGLSFKTIIYLRNQYIDVIWVDLNTVMQDIIAYSIIFGMIECVDKKLDNDKYKSFLNNIKGLSPNPREEKNIKLVIESQNNTNVGINLCVIQKSFENIDYKLKSKVSSIDRVKLSKDELRKRQEQLIKFGYDYVPKESKVDNENNIILELDPILDKINNFGIDSLSDIENDFLDKISKS